MTRIFALPVIAILTTIAALAADQLPSQSEEPDSFDIEPPLLKGNFQDESLPATTGDIARLEKQLERAKRNAASAERLCKIGVLSKMEVEQRFLRIVQCESDLANARLAQATEQVAEQEPRIAPDENAQAELDAGKIALAQLTEAAQVAAQKRERAELDFAEANLRRQQKLLKLGSAQKSDVARAEQKLAELKAQRN
jgi:multidrug resistance efflux pump